jgi:hypothetical protein
MGTAVEIRPAFNWLIKYYFAYQNDDSQAMYSYDRSHHLFNTFRDNRSNQYKEKKTYYLNESDRKNDLPKVREEVNQLNEQNKITEKELIKKNLLTQQLKSYKRQEKQIRQMATQDRLLYLFAKDNLNKLQLSQHVPTPSWTLKNIESTLLNTAIAYELPISETGKTLFHPDCKVRNLGTVRLLACDRKLPSLFKYYSSSETRINQAEIRAELASYRRAKVKIMKSVHDLEEKIMQHCGENLIKAPQEQESIFGTARHGEFLYTLYTILLQSEKLSDKDSLCFKQALLIRNALSHNEYPDADYFSSLVETVDKEKIPENPANHRKIAEKLVEALDDIYRPWLKYLLNHKIK